MSKEKNIYMYPMWEIPTLKKEHPYIDHLCNSLLPHANIINLGKRPLAGVFDMALYTFKMDTLYLNWIEDLSFRKHGTMQAIFFIFYCRLIKILGIKIIWTHHNKSSHAANNKLNKFLIRFLCRHATTIVAHTKESSSILKNCTSKLFYFFHPVAMPDTVEAQCDYIPAYDLLIWGNMRKSKGVGAFLSFLEKTNRLRSFKINIVGKFESEWLFNQFTECYKTENINIENRFIAETELKVLHAKAKRVLFPYTGSSVLNSGALVQSLVFGTPIIGPPIGAFNDLNAEGLIDVYNSFEDIISLISKNTPPPSKAEIASFCQQHSWKNFAQKIFGYL